MAWAEVLECSDIFIGVNAIDYSGYPDCRPEFIAAFEAHGESRHQSRRRRTAPHLKIHTPLAQLNKAGIVKLAAELGLDFALTHSCYDPDAERPPLWTPAIPACSAAKVSPKRASRSAPVPRMKISEIFYSHSRRRNPRRSPQRVHPHQRLQSALHLVRHAVHFLESRRPRNVDRRNSGRSPRRYPARHAVVTGGEPMIFDETIELTRATRHARYHRNRRHGLQTREVRPDEHQPQARELHPHDREGGRGPPSTSACAISPKSLKDSIDEYPNTNSSS